MLTTAVGEMNTWKSSYGNKTSLQALFNFHQVTKLSHLNRILALFQCISALCKQVIELKSLVTVRLVTVAELLKADLERLSLVLHRGFYFNLVMKPDAFVQ